MLAQDFLALISEQQQLNLVSRGGFLSGIVGPQPNKSEVSSCKSKLSQMEPTLVFLQVQRLC